MRPLVVVLAMTVLTQAENWPQFRGETGLGYTGEVEIPVSWNGKSGEGIAWKAVLPKSDNGFSSPIVWEDRVFVTCATNDPLTHRVFCFNTGDGTQRWESTIEPGPLHLQDLRGGYCAPTPCTDGKRIYVVFGSAVVAALDFEGRLIWRKTLANTAFDVALGSSPIFYQDTIILDCDQTGKTSSIIAFAKETGDIRWEARRPDVKFAHSTPVIVEVGHQPQMLVNASNAIQGVDPNNGNILWWCSASGDASSPAFDGHFVFSDSGRGGKAVCVDPGGEGDVTKTHVRWTYPQIPEGLSSPVIVKDAVWRTHNPETLKCIRMGDGSLAFSARLAGVSTWASPFATPDGRIYFASAGKSYVLRAGDSLEIISTNEIGEENRASAAVSNGRIFLRGDKSLYCIAKP